MIGSYVIRRVKYFLFLYAYRIIGSLGDADKLCALEVDNICRYDDVFQVLMSSCVKT